MGKKRFSFVFDSPFVVIFALICTVVFLLDTFVVKGGALVHIFSCPGARGMDAFRFNSPLCYVRLFIHIAGNYSPFIFLASVSFLLFFGPQMEVRYGTPMIALMTVLSAFVTGVLNACISSSTINGMECVIFLLIVLSAADSLMKKNLELSRILSFVAYTAFVIFTSYGEESAMSSSLIHTLVAFLGGTVGGLIGFLVAPKKSTEKKATEKKVEEKSVTVRQQSQSSSDVTVVATEKKKKRPRKLKKVHLDEDVPTETVIGTIS